MKTILVCNQKGGVGKTMISDEIAFALDRTGVEYNFYDLDQQGGCIHSDKPEIKNAKYAVVDTPGALQKDLIEWMKDASVIVIPTRMTTRDMTSLEKMIEIVKKNKIKAKVIYVFNCQNSYRSCRDFEEWFREDYPDLRVMSIPQSEVFVQASLEEKSVVEYKKNSPAAEKITALTAVILYELGIKQ